MPVSNEYIAYAIEQCAELGEVTSRRMFGGASLYHDGLGFALIADDVLYLKVDDNNRSDFEAAGMGQFFPYGDESRPMAYYEVPIDVLEDPSQLKDWAQGALAVARAKAVKKSAKKKPAKKKPAKKKPAKK